MVLRGQFDVSLDDHMTFSRHFGELALSPPSPVTGKRGEAENVLPEIAVVSNIERRADRRTWYGGRQMAHRLSFFDIPPAGGLLRAIEVPEDGSGATSFLTFIVRTRPSPTISNRGSRQIATIAPLRSPAAPILMRRPAIRQNRRVPVIRSYAPIPRRDGNVSSRPPARRPVVGLPVDESEEVLDAVWDHATGDEFSWTHKWLNGDMVMWDNRCVMHRRDAFDPSLRRHMQRTQIVGTQPV